MVGIVESGCFFFVSASFSEVGPFLYRSFTHLSTQSTHFSSSPPSLPPSLPISRSLFQRKSKR